MNTQMQAQRFWSVEDLAAVPLGDWACPAPFWPTGRAVLERVEVDGTSVGVRVAESGSTMRGALVFQTAKEARDAAKVLAREFGRSLDELASLGLTVATAS